MDEDDFIIMTVCCDSNVILYYKFNLTYFMLFGVYLLVYEK